jgi:hypothetical protein
VVGWLQEFWATMVDVATEELQRGKGLSGHNGRRLSEWRLSGGKAVGYRVGTNRLFMTHKSHSTRQIKPQQPQQ